jgi:hypothetical protein
MRAQTPRQPRPHRRGDLVEATADYAQDAVLEAHFRGAVHARTFHGREAIGRWIDNWFSRFERRSYRFQIEESIDNGGVGFRAPRPRSRP